MGKGCEMTTKRTAYVSISWWSIEYGVKGTYHALLGSRHKPQRFAFSHLTADVGGGCPGRGEICGKFELRFCLIRGSSFRRAARHRDRTLTKVRTCNSWHALFGVTGSKRKTARREKESEWEDLMVTAPLPNMGQHSPGVTGSQPNTLL